MNGEAVDIIAFGGLGQFGMNCTVLRSGDDLAIIDAGMAFPPGDFWGIDAIVPDLGRLLDSGARAGAIVLTHGHEDHIGGVSYLMERTTCPVYGSDLTLAYLRERLRERGVEAGERLVVVAGRERVDTGPFSIEFLDVTHSIPGSFALALQTPAGVIVHSADFKLDPTPVAGPLTDLVRLASLGRDGVKALLLDSTNAFQEGSTPSERRVGEAFGKLLAATERRVFVSTFSSHIHRIQQLVDCGIRAGRKIALVGRRMISSVGIARERGRLRFPASSLASAEEAMELAPERCLVIAGGTQGEPASAMRRIARGAHPDVRVERGDVVVHSARPIPGNEVAIGRMFDDLARQGAQILTPGRAPSADGTFHVSGHASAGDLAALIGVLQPEIVFPVHGTHRHLLECARLAQSVPRPPRSTVVAENGDIIRLDRTGARVDGRLSVTPVFVDRTCERVEEEILQERKHMAADGILLPLLVRQRSTGRLLSEPRVLSRGFTVPSGGDDLLREAARLVARTIEALATPVPGNAPRIADRERIRAATEEAPREDEAAASARAGDGAAASRTTLEQKLSDEVRRFVRRRTGKRPLVTPIVIEV